MKGPSPFVLPNALERYAFLMEKLRTTGLSPPENEELIKLEADEAIASLLRYGEDQLDNRLAK